MKININEIHHTTRKSLTKILTEKMAIEKYLSHRELEFHTHIYKCVLSYDKKVDETTKYRYLMDKKSPIARVVDSNKSGLYSKNGFKNIIEKKLEKNIYEHCNQLGQRSYKNINIDMTNEEIAIEVHKYGFYAVIDKNDGIKNVNTHISQWMLKNKDKDFIDCYFNFNIELGYVEKNEDIIEWIPLKNKKEILEYLHNHDYDIV